jgi:hypothetical protein
MQGKSENILTSTDKIQGFCENKYNHNQMGYMYYSIVVNITYYITTIE